jgi:hypothetical protein
VKYFKGSFQDPVNFFQMPMVNAVARELARSYVAAANSSSSSNSAFAWSPQLVRFPHPSLQSMNLLGQVLASFIFASLMFNCVSQVGVCVLGWERRGLGCVVCACVSPGRSLRTVAYMRAASQVCV